jgi:hypothetical protein
VLVVVAVASAMGIGIAVVRGWLPGATLVATRGLATAVALATRSPRPPLKAVGWSLALTSAAAALILISAAWPLS